MTEQAAGAPKTRPTLLTVICILSFIGIGFSTIWGIITSLAGAAMSAGGEMINEAVTEAGGTADTAAMEEAGGGVMIYGVLIVLGAIVSLIGVIQMWKLKKKGFFMYIIGQVLSIASGFFLEVMDPVTGETVSGFSVGSLFMPLIFIILYGINLKHMD